LRLVVAAVAFAALLILLVIAFSWHSPYLRRSDVVGTYVAKYPSGTERLELKRDGTFVQEVVLKVPQDTVTRSGTWTFNEATQTLMIRDCMRVGREGDISPTFRTDLGCFLPVERSAVFFGPITLTGGTYPVTGLWSSPVGLRKVD
jgi:hypothetical protein